MKQFLNCAVLGIILAGLFACGSDRDPLEDGNHRLGQGKNKIYSVALSLGGDYVDESEEPITKDGSTSNSYVGINVTRSAIGNAGSELEQYAFGMYTRKNNISILLVSGYNYNFEATVITDNTDIYNRTNQAYAQPFRFRESGSEAVNYTNDWVNKFIYASKISDDVETYPGGMCDLNSGVATVAPEGNLTNFQRFAFPRVHRYYGQLADFNPALSSEAIIDLAYKSFGIKMEVVNMPEETYVTCRDVSDDVGSGAGLDQNHNRLIFPENLKLDAATNNTWEEVYSLYNLSSDDPKQLKLKFTWHKGGGITEDFECTTTVDAKKRRILRIDVTGTANTTKTGNIILKEDTNDMEDETEDVKHSGK